jgi:hypothetical protein
VRFVYELDPNPKFYTNDSSALPLWPRYDLSRPVNRVLNASRSYVEDDTYRKEGIAYMNSAAVARELLS